MNLVRIAMVAVLMGGGCGDDGGASADGGMDDAGPQPDGSGTPRVCLSADMATDVRSKDGPETVELPYVIAGGISLVGPARSAELGADFMLEVHFTDGAEWSVDDLSSCSGSTPEHASCAGRELVTMRATIPQGAEVGEHTGTLRLLDGTTVEATLTIGAISDDPFAEDAAVSGSLDYKQGAMTVSGEFGTPFCAALLAATI